MSNSKPAHNQITFNQWVVPAIGRFNGGIHPEEYKEPSKHETISELASPNRLYIPIGKDPILHCSIGDTVSQGQVLVTAKSDATPPIHAPLDAIVLDILEHSVGHPSGLKQPCILLEKSSEHPPQQTLLEPLDWQTVDAESLLERVKAAGIVGLGGATFPTHIKLNARPIKHLIINAMECEPYITCDDRLLQEKADQVILGAIIAAKIVSAEKIDFAIEDNKKEAIAALAKVLQSQYPNENIKVVVAPTKYPSGGEKQTIQLVTGQQLTQGQLPASMGLLVQNVATVHAIFQAVVNATPLVSRVVTITGNLVTPAGNYIVPFGTPISHIMSQLKIKSVANQSVIIGGPLMGVSVTDLATPVTKATNCLIFNHQNADEKLWLTQASEHQACIRCGECDKTCPVDLLPQQLYWFSQSDQWEKVEQQGLFDCIECGACAYVCPSEIPLVQYYRYAKSNIKSNQQKQLVAERAKQRYDFRQLRLERAKQEKAKKHQQAAEARRLAAQNKAEDPDGRKAAINAALERAKQKKSQQISSKKEQP
ncbi:electron transport complex subunit RsxC [Aliikangiella sp. IMCC44632]